MPGVPHYRLLSREGRRRPRSRRVLIDVGQARPFERDEWESSVVVVERGHLMLCWRDGATLTFSPGDVLCLAPLGLVALRAVGPTPTLLLVVRR